MKFEKYRIALLGFLILMTLTLLAGISVFMVMQHQAESMLSRRLEVSLKSGMDLFGNQITERMDEAQMIATRPFIIDNLSKPEQTKNQLHRTAESFVAQGVNGVAIYNVTGTEVARAGHFVQSPKLRMPVDAKGAYLIWDGQFMLHVRADIKDQHGRIGSVVLEASLKLPAHALDDIASIGSTGEFALCSPFQEKEMNCFLHRTSGWEFQRLQRLVNNQALPMDYALNGKTGLIHARDYRGANVIAAYVPLQGLTLAGC